MTGQEKHIHYEESDLKLAPGVLGIWGTRLFIFRELGVPVIISRDLGSKLIVLGI